MSVRSWNWVVVVVVEKWRWNLDVMGVVPMRRNPGVTMAARELPQWEYELNWAGAWWTFWVKVSVKACSDLVWTWAFMLLDIRSAVADIILWLLWLLLLYCSRWLVDTAMSITYSTGTVMHRSRGERFRVGRFNETNLLENNPEDPMLLQSPDPSELGECYSWEAEQSQRVGTTYCMCS